MDALVDQPMTDAVTTEDPRLPLSADEQKVLDLWDQIQQLQLEIAIINAQNKIQPSESLELSAEETEAKRNELLDVRGQYILRNQVVESVLSANPILKAVHNGTDASPVERDLLPLIEKRDEMAIQSAQASSTTSDVRGQSMQAQSQALRASRQNVNLASEVISLGAELKQKKFSYYQDDPEARETLQHLENEVGASRRRWRVLKAITSGVVTASGVDWARDHVLRDLVLDTEDDDGLPG